MAPEVVSDFRSPALLANVAGLTFRGPADETTSRAHDRLSSLLVESRVIDEDPEAPTIRLVAIEQAFAALDVERVLVLRPLGDSIPEAAILLALTCWPPADAILWQPSAPSGAPAPFCGIFRREVCLEQARACLSRGEDTVDAMFADFPAVHLSSEDLGLVDQPRDTADWQPPSGERTAGETR